MFLMRVRLSSGWGTIHFGGPVSTVLQEVVVPVWSRQDCSNAYPGKVFSGMMCAGLKTGGKDSCQVSDIECKKETEGKCLTIFRNGVSKGDNDLNDDVFVS